MAHWAKIDENNIVTDVIVTSNDEADEGEAWVHERLGGRWIKTSYNTRHNQHLEGGVPFRGNFAGKGFYYDEDLDVFVEPKPFDSWIFDQDTVSWKAPKEKPLENGDQYVWDEEAQDWKELS